ncbi:MAG TPA: glycosyltransferase, partial [Anaerolineae bacterium]
MKIGVLTHNYPRFRGDFSGHFVEALSEELIAAGHQVTILAPWDPAYARLPSDHHIELELYRYAPRPEWHRLGYMRSMRADVDLRLVNYALAPGLFAAGANAVLRWAGRARPDVLHAHWAVPNGFLGALASRRYGIPLVVSIPGSDATVAAQNPLFGAMARFAFRQAGLVTACSESLRDVAVETLGADPGKFDLIAYGVDPKALWPDPAGTAELRASLGIPRDAVVVLAVGRMVYKKGFDVLLRAAGLLRAEEQAVPAGRGHNGHNGHLGARPSGEPSFHLVMVGEGDLWQEWQALAAGMGLGDRIHWIGTVPMDRMRVYYNLADLAVMPAVTHPATGLAVTVLDAMSCAKPIVASDAAGNRLAVKEGVNGLIVPEKDEAALAQALSTLIADPDLRRRMGAESRRLIDEELGWPQLAARYAEHFSRL